MAKLSQRWQKLRTWLETPLGDSLLEAEKKEVTALLTKLFGYHLVVMGEPQFSNCIVESVILHRIWLHTFTIMKDNISPLTARPDKMPLMTDSVDVIYLAHCLEGIKNPHEVLRESYRALVPEGSVIISNFNPWSLWGLWRWIVRYLKRTPWDGQFITITRLKDWLALLGFDVIQVRHYYYRPPISHPKLLLKLQWLEKVGAWCWPFWSGSYVVLAKKRIIALTPIKPSWQPEPKLEVPSIIEPVRNE